MHATVNLASGFERLVLGARTHRLSPDMGHSFGFDISDGESVQISLSISRWSFGPSVTFTVQCQGTELFLLDAPSGVYVASANIQVPMAANVLNPRCACVIG